MDLSKANIVSYPDSSTPIEENGTNTTYSILDILPRECIENIFLYVPIICLIKSERVNKQWRDIVNAHVERRCRTFYTFGSGLPVNLISLQRFLLRAGKGLRRLKIFGYNIIENDFTGENFDGDLCTNLEKFEAANSAVKYYTTMLLGCKKLKTLLFHNCQKTDELTTRLIDSSSSIEKLSVLCDSEFTGNFLIVNTPMNIKHLDFYGCISLTNTTLKNLYKLPNLTTLKIDGYYEDRWKDIPDIIQRLTQLTHLSLRSYNTANPMMLEYEERRFCQALSKLTLLKQLYLEGNVFITDNVMKQIAESCKELEILDVSDCNGLDVDVGYTGVSHEGLSAVLNSCKSLIKIKTWGLKCRLCADRYALYVLDIIKKWTCYITLPYDTVY